MAKSRPASGKAAFILNLSLLVAVAVLTFPVWYYFMAPMSIDLSWVYALNYFSERGVLFGRDVVFNYGPFGYLFHPMDMGDNMARSTAFLVAIWALFLGLVALGTARKRHGTPGLLALTAALAIGIRPLYAYGFGDYLLCFLGLYLLARAVTEERWRPYYLMALAAASFLALVKLSSALVVLSGAAAFVPATVFKNRDRSLRALAYLLVAFPLASAAMYLAYNPSLRDLALYLRGMYEITSGYSTAMSLEGDPAELYLALAVSVLYAALAFVLMKFRGGPFRLSVVLAAPMFVVFKHGFVRHDGQHVVAFFASVPYLFGLLIMHSRAEGRKAAALAYAAFALAAVACYAAQSRYYSVLGLTVEDSFETLKNAANYGDTRVRLAEAERASLGGYLMPEEARKAVGDERVGVFTVEYAYVAANSLNFAPMPVFHTYQANTPYLDRLNASYLEDPARAPRFMFVDENLAYLDGRSAIADAPATWLSFYRWYDAAYRAEAWALFERRRAPRFGDPVLIGSQGFRPGDRVEVPRSPHPVLAKIYMEPGVRGGLAKVFFRVPEVIIVAHARSGERLRGRVVPTMEDGLFINYQPFSFDGVVALFERGESVAAIDSFELTGEGAAYYREAARVEFYELSDVWINLAPPDGWTASPPPGRDPRQ